jgi:hypothetical protein
LFLEDPESFTQGLIREVNLRFSQVSQDIIDLGDPAAFGIGGIEDQRTIRRDVPEGEDHIALFVGALVLDLAGIEIKIDPIHLNLKAVEDPVRLDVIKHVGLPEEDYVPVIGVNLFVNVLVQGGIAEIYGAAFTEIALEKGEKLIEEFFAELGERFQSGVDILFKMGKNTFGVVAGFDPHQVDETRFAFNLRADEDVPQGGEKLVFMKVAVGHIVPLPFVQYDDFTLMPSKKPVNLGENGKILGGRVRFYVDRLY